MKDHNIDYPIPNGIIAFWIFVVPPLTLMLFTLLSCVIEILHGRIAHKETSMIIGLSILLLLSVIFASFVANSFPAIRMSSEGIEVRFYFPFLTRWISLPWNSITQVKTYFSPTGSLFKKQERGIMIFSNHLPIIYYLPSLIWGRSIDRSIIIGKRIKQYNEVLIVLEAKKKL